SGGEEVAARSAFALASVQERGAEPALAARLDDPRPPVAAAAAFALGRMGSERAAEALLGALSSSPGVESIGQVIRSLGLTMGESQLERFLALDRMEGELAEAVMAVARAGVGGQMNGEGLAWLAEHLSHPAEEVRVAAAYYFSRAPDAGEWRGVAEAVRTALAALDPQDPAARFLIPGLAALGDTEDTPTFVRWTRASTDWRTRAVAVTALRDRLGDREAREAVLVALGSDPSSHVVEAAAAELARSRPALQAAQDEVVAWLGENGERWQPAAVLWSGLAPLGEGDRILEWLDRVPEDDALARAAAVEALSRVPGTAYLDRLFDEAEGRDDRVAASAYRGLAGHFGAQREDGPRLERFESAFVQGLSRSHPTIVGTAARGLTDPVLLERGSASALEAALLARDPTDPSDAASSAALIDALSQTRDTSWVGLLQRYLDHPQGRVRTAAREAIESLTLRPLERRPRVDEAAEALVMDWEDFPEARPEILIETTKGPIRVVLAHEEAPLTVQTFLRLARAGAYDGVPFHRVVPSFVIQGGDVGRRDGTGGPGFSIRTELTRIPFERGVLGMASAGRDTEGSQFFIMHARAPHLDDRYTSFGWVLEGMDVVDRLLRGDRILRVSSVSERVSSVSERVSSVSERVSSVSEAGG
ncbi:MAG: hypothetical protein HKO53_13520, partial [Gemmatimonadetes bacterium]|nr:hypothetical protein [Gemmatimonadota bacterium]